ncbi:MAG: YggS family pyridoxal phosphate-dependent enzyme [Chlorobi bacterium]|nr:YggS family pyridoxal phosphate-dependent enzyme [Chlorobiota bacterium]
MNRIVENYLRLKKELDEYGVDLIVVSKGQPIEAIRAIYEAGHRDFGENRVQELRKKKTELPEDIRWHMIGHLQTNKIKYLIPWIYMIQSVDRDSLMHELNKRVEKHNTTVSCLIEVHIAKEESKHGMTIEQVYEFFETEQYNNYPNLKFVGLMGMATYTDDTTLIRNEFRTLRKIFEDIKKTFSDFKHLSMGMSNDYKIAIEEGTTMVRIGSLIFAEE